MKKVFYILALIFCVNNFCYSLKYETEPQFPGGEKARLKYIEENFRYPQSAIDSGIQGTVHIMFVVEPDGSITNVRIARGIGGGCDEEAIRLVEGMPNWIPGKLWIPQKQIDEPVRTQFSMPIKFLLDKELGKCSKYHTDDTDLQLEPISN